MNATRSRPEADEEGIETAEIAFDFSAAVGRFEGPLLRYAGQLLSGGEAEAQDVVQETFLRLHLQVSEHGEESIRHLPTWLYRVAHNLVQDHHRRRGRRQAGLGEVQRAGAEREARGDEADRLGELIRQEAGRQALAEVRRLPGEQREALLLRVIQGLTFREIATVMGLTPGNVAYHLGRGLAEVARRLKEAQLI